jgi:hypothetical protein
MKQQLFLLSIFFLVLMTSVHGQSLFVTMVNQDPDPVRAGQVVEVRFKLENLWETTEEDMLIEVIPEYPFTLYSGEAQKRIGKPLGRVAADETIIVDFKLKVDPRAVDGDHEIKLKLTRGSTEWIYEDQFFIDIEKEDISLKAYIRSSDFVTSGTKGTVTLELANAGESEIQFLQLELLPSADYKLLSTSNYVYLGDLDPDDTETEDFTLYIEEGKTEVALPVKVYYKVDDENYEDSFTLKLNLLTTSEAKKIGLIESSNLNAILIVVAIILIGIFVYRRFLRHRRR